MLRRVSLHGFKSIKAMDLELRSLNVLIGANGAGKSNLISFFKLLNEMMAGRLQQYIGATGRAHSLLHFGPKVTPQIEARLEFNSDDIYIMRLFHASGDTLIFAEETLSLLLKGRKKPVLFSLGAGHEETRIAQEAESKGGAKGAFAKTFRDLLNQCRVYHFHDTSPTARVRQYGYVGNNRWLMPDAGNLAALLLRYREENGGSVYRRIVSTIRLIAPFFVDFDLVPEGPNHEVILNWRDEGSDELFGPHQLSDGTLRAMCLVTLLMQAEADLPKLIVVDEPELGLHPYALNVIASLFKKASHHTQVLISTQSRSFLDSFDPEDVVVVNREGRESQISRLDPGQLEAWLDEYTLGEVWEKNVFGGGPH